MTRSLMYLDRQSRLVNGTGNPWVKIGVTVPLPKKTRTHGAGMGFCVGQNFYTPGIPLPVPKVGNPWVSYLIYQLQ